MCGRMAKKKKERGEEMGRRRRGEKKRRGERGEKKTRLCSAAAFREMLIDVRDEAATSHLINCKRGESVHAKHQLWSLEMCVCVWTSWSRDLKEKTHFSRSFLAMRDTLFP